MKMRQAVGIAAVLLAGCGGGGGGGGSRDAGGDTSANRDARAVQPSDLLGVFTGTMTYAVNHPNDGGLIDQEFSGLSPSITAGSSAGSVTLHTALLTGGVSCQVDAVATGGSLAFTAGQTCSGDGVGGSVSAVLVSGSGTVTPGPTDISTGNELMFVLVWTIGTGNVETDQFIGAQMGP